MTGLFNGAIWAVTIMKCAKSTNGCRASAIAGMINDRIRTLSRGAVRKIPNSLPHKLSTNTGLNLRPLHTYA